MSAVRYIGAATLAVLAALTDGVLVKSCWWWFVHPLGAPGISTIGWALGLALFVRHFFPGKTDGKMTVPKFSIDAATRMAVNLVALGCAWTLHSVMLR